MREPDNNFLHAKKNHNVIMKDFMILWDWKLQN